MNLVNTETGEIVEFDRAAAERRAERINLRLDAIADNYRAVLPMIREAIEKRDDLALGYRSPGEYVRDRFGQSLAGLGIEVRRAVVGELTEAGLSTRAIAPVVGVSHMQVARDISTGVTDVTPAPRATPDPKVDPQGALDAAIANATAIFNQAPEGESRLAATATPAQTARPPVTGIDGKTYSRPTPTPKPERSGEQQNAEENSLTLASALIFLLAFQHPNQRDTARIEWEVGRWSVAPTKRAYVTPNHMREAARGLLDLADEWETTDE